MFRDEHSDVNKTCDGMVFDFYAGLPHDIQWNPS